MKRKLEKKFPAWPTFVVTVIFVALLVTDPKPTPQQTTAPQTTKKELQVYIPVPEPPAYALLVGLGLLFFVTIRRRDFRE